MHLFYIQNHKICLNKKFYANSYANNHLSYENIFRAVA